MPSCRLTDAATIDAPYPYYAELRDEAPLHWSEPLSAWVLSRFADVARGLLDPRLSSDKRGLLIRAVPVTRVTPELRRDYERLDAFFARWPAFSEGEAHSRLRALLRSSSSGGELDPLRLAKRAVQIVRTRMDDVSNRTSCDLVSDFAKPLACEVVVESLGLPGASEPWIRETERIMACLGQGVPRPDACRDACDALTSLAGLLATPPSPGKEERVFARLSREADEETALALLVNLITAGYTPLASAVTNAIFAIVHGHPSLPALASASADERAGLVEECLRIEAPFLYASRRTVESSAWYGRVVPAGSRVLLLLGAANRDDRMFDAPDELRPGRKNACEHLSLGKGGHYCFGSPVVRAVLDEVLASAPELDARWDLASAAPRWEPFVGLRCMESWTPVARRSRRGSARGQDPSGP